MWFFKLKILFKESLIKIIKLKNCPTTKPGINPIDLKLLIPVTNWKKLIDADLEITPKEMFLNLLFLLFQYSNAEILPIKKMLNGIKYIKIDNCSILKNDTK